MSKPFSGSNEVEKMRPARADIEAPQGLMFDDSLIRDLNDIKDPTAFKAQASQLVSVCGRITVVAAIAIGRVLETVKARMPGEFNDWLGDNDIAISTALTYRAFARNAGPILESKRLQNVGHKRLFALCSLPEKEVEQLAKGDRVDGKSLDEWGVLSPAEIRRLIKQRDKLKTAIEQKESEIEKGHEQLEAARARIRDLEAGRPDPAALDNDAFQRRVNEIGRDLTAGLYRALRELVPATPRQLIALTDLCTFTANSLAMATYDRSLQERWPDDIRAAFKKLHEVQNPPDPEIIDYEDTRPAPPGPMPKLAN